MTSSTGEISQTGINSKLKEIIHEIELEVEKDVDNTGLASAKKEQINIESGTSTKGAAPSSASPGGGILNSVSTSRGSVLPSETISKRSQASETAGKGHSSRVRVIPVRIVDVEGATADSCSDARRFVPREERGPVSLEDMSGMSSGGFGEDGDRITHSVPGQTLQGSGGHYSSGHYAEDELRNRQHHQSATARPYNPFHIRTGQWKSANPAMEQTFVKREFQCMPESADRATLQHQGDAPVLRPVDHLAQISSGEERKHDQCAINRDITPQGWSERSKSGSQVLQRRSSFGSHSSIPKKVHFAEEPEVKIYETAEAESTPEDLLPQFNVNKNKEEEEEEDSDEDDGELIVHEMKEDMWKEEDVEGYGEVQDSGQEEQNKQDDVDTDPRSVQTEHLVEEDQQVHDQSGIQRLSETLDKQVDQSEQDVEDKQGMLHCDGNSDYVSPLMTNSGEDDFTMLNPAELSNMDHQSSQLPSSQPLSHHLPTLKNEDVPSCPQMHPTLQLSASADVQSPFCLLPTAEMRYLIEHAAKAGSQPIQKATEAASLIEHHDPDVVRESPSSYPEAHSSIIYSQPPDSAFQTRESTQVSSATDKPDPVSSFKQYSSKTQPSESSTSLYTAPIQLSSHEANEDDEKLPKLDNFQPLFHTEEAPSQEYRSPERPLSPLIKLLIRGITNRAARPYGRTSPLFVRGGQRKSPFRLPGSDATLPPQPSTEICSMEENDASIKLDDMSCQSENDEEALNEQNEQASQSEGEMPVPKAPPPPPPPVTRDDFRKPRKSKALFVDSAFFSTRDHPTWEDQVKMARKIAASLSDATNRHSRGQTMYERRKKRSPRWIHQGGAPLTSEDYRGPTLTVQTKPLFELIMNPQGQLLDLESLRDKGVVINTESLSPELCAELISDLHSARGKGGQIFARRKKRSERWVVDEFHPEPSRPGERPTTQLPQPKPRHVQHEHVSADPWRSTWGEARHDAASGEDETLKHMWTEGREKVEETDSGINTTLHSVRLEDLWQPYHPARFPTDGVYSPIAPQGWHAANTEPPSAALSFPENVNPPPGGTVSDAAAEPDLRTASNIETVDTWDWSTQQQRRQPPPTATLFESPIESLRAMEEMRRQGQSNYTPQAWSDHSGR